MVKLFGIKILYFAAVIELLASTNYIHFECLSEVVPGPLTAPVRNIDSLRSTYLNKHLTK